MQPKSQEPHLPKWIALVLALLGASVAPTPAEPAASWPAPVDGNYTVPEFRFADGEKLRNGTGGDTNQFLHDLAVHHLDPVDRLLIAQARMNDLSIVTADRCVRTVRRPQDRAHGLCANQVTRPTCRS